MSEKLQRPSSSAATLSGSVAAPSVVVGISGARQNATVAVAVDGVVRAVCEQERLTRVRRAGLKAGVLPEEAVSVVLSLAGGLPLDAVRTYAVSANDITLPAGLPVVGVDHHRAHAVAAFSLSPYESAAVLVCDRGSAEQTSVWRASRDRLARVDWAPSATGFTELYAECSALFGLSAGQEHELEALARLDPGTEADRFGCVIEYRDGALRISPRWKALVADWLTEGGSAAGLEHQARVASAFQRHFGAQLLALVGELRDRTGERRLCLGGGLFYNTYLNTLLQQSGLFDAVFTPPNPGNAGTAVGAAAGWAETEGFPPPARVSPFLGPDYDGEVIKRTLDNCKLSYELVNEQQAIDLTVDALCHGLLVGWFQGRMEWGHRALGNRSILASPLSPYVLDNLNVFLKRRARHRAYGLSVRQEDVSPIFSGPEASPYMEFEYQPRDDQQFRAVAPRGTRTIRVQTVPDHPDEVSSQRYRRLHEAFGAATGVPVLVNTSFNGFLEPMVCSPRDAIRVFFGTGLDVLVLDRFVVRK